MVYAMRYVLSFPDRATALAALEPLGYAFPESEGMGGETVPARFDATRVVEVQLHRGYATVQRPGIHGELVDVRVPQLAPGFHLGIITDAPDDRLTPIEGASFAEIDPTKVDADGNRPTTPAGFVTQTNYSPQLLAAIKQISPQFLGDAFPFPGDVPAA